MTCHRLQCTVLELLELFQMNVKRRRLPNFESCSVALFTSLALGGAALPARAQPPSSPPTASTHSAAPSASSTARPNSRSRPAGQRMEGPSSSVELDEPVK